MAAPTTISEHKRRQVLQKLRILDTAEEQTFQDAAILAARTCGVSMALINLIDCDRQWIKAKFGFDDEATAVDLPFCAHAIRQRGPLVVEDASKDARFAASEVVKGPFHLRFYAGVPIYADGIAVGTLCLLDKKPRAFSSENAWALSALAQQVSALLEFRLLEESVKSDKCELKLAIEEASEKENLLRYSAERFESLFASLPVACMTLDTDGKVMEWNAMSETVYGFTAAEALFKNVINLVVPKAMRAKARRRFAQTIRSGGHYPTAEWQVVRKDGIPLWVLTTGFPLHGPTGALVGVISTNVDITARKQAEALLLESNSLIEGQRLELEMANSRLETLAFTDGLTGLHNHRAFQDSLHQSFVVAKRYHQNLSVILLDVDNFKMYNDAFGHLQGDVVLKQVAGIIKGSARDSDFVGRYGGEEFAVVLPNTDAKGAAEVAERIRRAIAEAEWPNRPVTASLGVASLTLTTPDTADIIRRSDEALYESKASGRNCVSVSNESHNAAA
ncbi:MAG: sensor domain-containing diguanylate cyclase [Fimbriimonadaceae bacterium]